MSTVFYRYYRPQKYCSQRATMETSPYGGICLRFEPINKNTMWFTHARCKSETLFSRSIAREIVDKRATELSEYKYQLPSVPSNNTEPLVLADSIKYAIQNWETTSDQILIQYLKNEYSHLIVAIDYILMGNHLEKNKRGAHMLESATINNVGLYENLSR
jgi:hypothetical protein